ncbi:hypothetical protein [Brucella pseudogrignonensis]|uniref:Uncharacterized protein n=1 Tax=Brucella pseudogrignonensis TaxID=419475 RepID=A0ABU1MGB3_9HYPH|nr:hypothetical protein [Brucella pseudogrignonensis]MDR6434646.1 hypothetical protein [Brucella pseudogrignonensis]
MRPLAYIIAASALALSATAATAAPSISGIAGCILKENTKLGTDKWDVYIDTDYSGNIGAGTKVNACNSAAKNIFYGQFASANDVNNAFAQIEQEMYQAIKNEITGSRQTFTLNSPDPAITAGKVVLTAEGKRNTGFNGIVKQKEKTSVQNGGLDLTSLRNTFN